jgi:hypothetical protein
MASENYPITNVASKCLFSKNVNLIHDLVWHVLDHMLDYKHLQTIYEPLIGLPRFGPEPWFEPEPFRTGVWFSSWFTNYPWTGPKVQFKVQKNYYFCELVRMGPNLYRTVSMGAMPQSLPNGGSRYPHWAQPRYRPLNT